MSDSSMKASLVEMNEIFLNENHAHFLLTLLLYPKFPLAKDLSSPLNNVHSVWRDGALLGQYKTVS